MATFVLYHGVRYDPEIEAHCLASVCQSRKYAVEAAIVNGLRPGKSSVDGKTERWSMGLRMSNRIRNQHGLPSARGMEAASFCKPCCKRYSVQPDPSQRKHSATVNKQARDAP